MVMQIQCWLFNFTLVSEFKKCPLLVKFNFLQPNCNKTDQVYQIRFVSFLKNIFFRLFFPSPPKITIFLLRFLRYKKRIKKRSWGCCSRRRFAKSFRNKSKSYIKKEKRQDCDRLLFSRRSWQINWNFKRTLIK